MPASECMCKCVGRCVCMVMRTGLVSSSKQGLRSGQAVLLLASVPTREFQSLQEMVSFSLS